MQKKPLKVTRRQALATAATGAALFAAPGILRAANKTVKVGSLVPLTGDLTLWGLASKHGAELWAKRTNAAGGITVGGEKYDVEAVSYDGAYVAEKTLQGAQSFLDQDVKYTMVIGGDDWSALQEFSNRNKMLSSTMLVSDLNPNSTYLIGAVEAHPFYLALGVQYLKKVDPNVKTAALCSHDDVLGRSSLAMWRAGFDANGIEIVNDQYYDVATTDYAPIVSSMLAAKPDVVCIDSTYPSIVVLLVEQLFVQGYNGRVLHSGLELLDDMIKRSSKEFMEGSITFFPRFDDPLIGKTAVGFPDPNGFFAEYNAANPNEWNASSWEFASALEVWKNGVEKAGTFDADAVLASMKANPPMHTYGPAKWWGKDFLGIDNALFGNWPVIEIKDGRHAIVELGDQLAWFDAHKDVIEKRFREEKLMPDQRR